MNNKLSFNPSGSQDYLKCLVMLRTQRKTIYNPSFLSFVAAMADSDYDDFYTCTKCYSIEEDFCGCVTTRNAIDMLDSDVTLNWVKEGLVNVNDDSYRGTTILQMATENGNLDLVEACLDAGGDPDLVTYDTYMGMTFARSSCRTLARGDVLELLEDRENMMCIKGDGE